jgi:hypothetical protein
MTGDDDDERARIITLFLVSAVAAVTAGFVLGWILDSLCR